MQDLLNFGYILVHPASSLPFDYIPKRYLTSSIRLTNNTSHLVAYKIRTNSPFSYLVKPSIGLIYPQHSVNIDVTMQPSNHDQQAISLLKDKFLINACVVPEKDQQGIRDSPASLRELFKKVPESQVQTHKLKVELKSESVSCSEDSLETRSTSGNESSPIREDSSDQSEKGDRSFHTTLSDIFEKQGGEKEGSVEPSIENMHEMDQIPSVNRSRITKFHSFADIRPNNLLEKVCMLERANSMHIEGSRAEYKKHQKLMQQEEHNRLISQAIQERDTLKQHLEKVKMTVFEKEEIKKEAQYIKSRQDYYLWHILLVAMIGLMLGTLLKYEY